MSFRSCEQTKCEFHSNGCRKCSECGAEPNIIRKDCSVCISCEGLPDMLRWDDERLERERQLRLLMNPPKFEELIEPKQGQRQIIIEVK